MAILKNAEVWFAKLDPKYPNARMNKANPTWEVQLRTSDVEQKREWEAHGLKPKLIVGKEGEENEGEPILTEAGKKQWRVNLKRKSLKKDKATGEMVPNTPVKVVNGALDELPPGSVGNGSIAHIRIYQYEYESADGTPKLASVLMGLQVKKHIVYEAPAREDEFEMEDDTETIQQTSKAIPESTDDDEHDDGEATPAPTPKTAPKVAPKPAPKPAPAPVATADEHPEDAF